MNSQPDEGQSWGAGRLAGPAAEPSPEVPEVTVPEDHEKEEEADEQPPD